MTEVYGVFMDIAYEGETLLFVSADLNKSLDYLKAYAGDHDYIHEYSAEAGEEWVESISIDTIYAEYYTNFAGELRPSTFYYVRILSLDTELLR